MDVLPPAAGDPARGRRGNGLPADEWGALVDVDPRLSASLLDRLAGDAVAAWVEPAGATTDPVSRAGTLPARPLDRLWVDVARADDARRLVAAEAEQLASRLGQTEAGAGGVEQFLHAVPRGASGRVLEPPAPLLRATAPMPAEPDADRAWRSLVEAFEREADAPVPPWPVAEDLPAAEPGDGQPATDHPPGRRHPDVRAHPDGEPGLPGWLEPEPLPEEGHFEPPAPPPPPRLRARTVAACAAMVLGLVLLVTPSLLDVAPGVGTFVVGAALAAGGLAALIHGMRETAGPDDGPDDGAVV